MNSSTVCFRLGIKTIPNVDVLMERMVNKEDWNAAISSRNSDWRDEVRDILEKQALRYCKDMKIITDVISALYEAKGMEV